MKKTKLWLIGILLVCSCLFAGCKVGTASVFTHPTELGYDYSVTYDAMGGTINTLETRTVFYQENSPIYEPSGQAGVLTQPTYGNRVLEGWYTKYTEEEVNGETKYVFDEADRWDFENGRLTPEVCPDKTLTLYAHWAESPTLVFVDAENPEGGVLLEWTVEAGKAVSRPTSSEPTKEGYTLLDYYSDPECTQKFGFGQEISEEQMDENNQVLVYCRFIEGEYTRIKFASSLESIKDNMAGNYILAEDLDLAGATWTPIVGENGEAFTGTFIGNGYTISNFKMEAANRRAGLAGKLQGTGDNLYGLFEKAEGATFDGVNVSDVEITIDKTITDTLSAASLAATASNTVFTDCHVSNVTIGTTAGSSMNLNLAPIANDLGGSSMESCTYENVDISQVSTTGTVTSELAAAPAPTEETTAGAEGETTGGEN